jgi:hypothetical protein
MGGSLPMKRRPSDFCYLLARSAQRIPNATKCAAVTQAVEMLGEQYGFSDANGYPEYIQRGAPRSLLLLIHLARAV